MMFVQPKRIVKRTFQFCVKPLRPYFDTHVHVMRSGPARGLRRKGGFSFIPTPRSIEDKFLDVLNLEGMTVYDIGANVGVMALFFSRAVGLNGKVLAFEPNPDTIDLLKENIKINGFENIQIHKIALGNSSTRGVLVVHKEKRGSGSISEMIVQHYKRLGGNKWYNVQICQLDEYVKINLLPIPSFIKIDTEGYEYNCLLGMHEIIDIHHPKLLVEMHGITLEDKINNAGRVLDFLWRKGYSIQNISSDKIVSKRDYISGIGGQLYCTYGTE